MSERVVIVGGDAAGMSAASRLARRGPADQRVIVFEREEVVSYAACGMPYHLDDRIPDAGTLLIRSPAALADSGVQVHTGHDVTDLDVDAGTVTVRADGRERRESWDRLLLATGAYAVVPPLPGVDAMGVFTFRRFADLGRLRAYLEQHRPTTVTVVGAGYIGVELADVLTGRGLAVTLVEAESAVMADALDPPQSWLVHETLAEHGVQVRCGEKITGLQVRGNTVAGVESVAGTWSAELVVLAVGVRPAVTLAAAAAIPLDEHGAIDTDPELRTRSAGVWAAGDCAGTTDLVTGRRAWVPLGPAANKQGRGVADSMLGRPCRFPGVVGTALVQVFDLEVGRTGLTAVAAGQAGFDVDVSRISAADRAHYYPGAQPTTVSMVSDHRTGRLLGGQVVGHEGVAGRTNVLATAVQSHLDVEAVLGLDLGYAPPFAPVWDPILVAAHQFGRA